MEVIVQLAQEAVLAQIVVIQVQEPMEVDSSNNQMNSTVNTKDTMIIVTQATHQVTQVTPQVTQVTQAQVTQVTQVSPVNLQDPPHKDPARPRSTNAMVRIDRAKQTFVPWM